MIGLPLEQVLEQLQLTDCSIVCINEPSCGTVQLVLQCNQKTDGTVQLTTVWAMPHLEIDKT